MIQWIVFPWENPSEGFSRTPPRSGSTDRGDSRELPILRYGQVSSIVRFVLMPDGHLLSAEQKVGKDSPKRTKVLLENSPSGGLRFPPSAHLRRALSPLNALKVAALCEEGVGAGLCARP